MDGETIRLIVVALGAIIAGIAGQLMAGAFNSRNTIANIEAARAAAEAQLEADRDLEHDRWLRDRRIEAYVAFINQIRAVHQLIRDLQVGMAGTDGHFALIKRTQAVNAVEVRLLAPDDVSRASSGVMGAMRQLIVSSTEALSTKNLDAYIRDSETLIDRMDDLELLISRDVGITRAPE